MCIHFVSFQILYKNIFRKQIHHISSLTVIWGIHSPKINFGTFIIKIINTRNRSWIHQSQCGLRFFSMYANLSLTTYLYAFILPQSKEKRYRTGLSNRVITKMLWEPGTYWRQKALAIVKCTIQKEWETEAREDKRKLFVYCQYTHKLEQSW